MIGQALGHYRILDKLGAGGMGEVYLAEDTRLSRKVAVKVLPSASAADPDHLARFEREARVAAALNHPHIAVVYDVGVAQETRYIVQEYLEGTTLRELLCAGPVPLKRAVALALEIAEALAAAHSAGIVHRDLKPENIFVTREGHIKILDFGLAKLIERVELAGESNSTLLTPTPRTSSGQILGTAGYMAPEQIKGQPVDARADVFGFGCVAYEMLAGKPPFAGRSGVESLHRILHEEPDPMPDAARISTPLKWVLRKCLAKDPGERYQGALDLAVDLRHLRSDIESGTMSRISGFFRSRDSARRGCFCARRSMSGERCFRRMAAGWPMHRMNPAGRKSTCRPWPGRGGSGKSPVTAGQSRCGREMGARSFIAAARR